MRNTTVAVLLLVLVVSSFGGLINLASAQGSTEPSNPVIWVLWVRFNGHINEWGNETYHGSLMMNAKTVRDQTVPYKPWASVSTVWSNEQQPFASAIKPVGNFTYTHYAARLVWLITLKPEQEGLNLNLTGIWNVDQVKINYEFDKNGSLIKTSHEATSIATKAKGQLHMLDDWKRFEIEIEGIDTLKGVGFAMITTSAEINPFSFKADSTANFEDLVAVVRCFRAMPGFGNYVPELDYNLDSKIDIADLTTVAANM